VPLNFLSGFLLQVHFSTPSFDSFSTWNMYYGTMTIITRIQGDTVASYQFRSEQKRLWETTPVMLAFRPTEYKLVLSNYLVNAFLTKNFLPFKEIIKKLRSLPVTSLNDEGEVFQNTIYLEQLWYMNEGLADQAIDLIPKIELGLKKYGDKVNDARRQVLVSNIAIIQFDCMRFEECIDWSERVICFKTAHREDLKYACSILQLICHFQLGSLEILEGLSRSLRRKLDRHGRLYNYDKKLLYYVQKLFFCPDDLKPTRFYELIEYLEGISKLTSQTLCAEEIIRWAKRNIKGNPQ